MRTWRLSKRLLEILVSKSKAFVFSFRLGSDRLCLFQADDFELHGVYYKCFTGII